MVQAGTAMSDDKNCEQFMTNGEYLHGANVETVPEDHRYSRLSV